MQDERRRREALTMADPCRLCPRLCRVERRRGQLGLCGQPWGPVLHAHRVHHGEEPPISGERGSGTLFLSGCGLRCVYCQNHPFSQEGEGTRLEVSRLADRMLELRDRGCHNLNLVTGTQFLPWILEALDRARQRGLELPVVWNSSGYERIETLRLLAGVVDVYLADLRYGRVETARRLSAAPDYPTVAREALLEMRRQVGPLDPQEVPARRGLLVRHLVLPGHLEETLEVLDWIALELGRSVPVSLMGQYLPSHRADRYPPLGRRPHREEYERAEARLLDLGLARGWTQPPDEAYDRDRYWGRGF